MADRPVAPIVIVRGLPDTANPLLAPEAPAWTAQAGSVETTGHAPATDPGSGVPTVTTVLPAGFETEVRTERPRPEPTLATEITMAAARYRHVDAGLDADIQPQHSPSLPLFSVNLAGKALEAGGQLNPALSLQVQTTGPQSAAREVSPRVENVTAAATGSKDDVPISMREAAAISDTVAPGDLRPAAPPAPSPTPSPAATIVSALALDGASRPQTVTLSPQAPGHRMAAASHTLRIQLNPVHLGVVDATLRASGTQLTIEIRVETREAFERLRADGDVIEKALRGQGFEAVQVTVIHSPVAPSPAARSDAQAFQAASQQPNGNASDPGSSSGGHRPQGQQEDGHARNRQPSQTPPPPRDGAGGGGTLYI